MRANDDLENKIRIIQPIKVREWLLKTSTSDTQQLILSCLFDGKKIGPNTINIFLKKLPRLL